MKPKVGDNVYVRMTVKRVVFEDSEQPHLVLNYKGEEVAALDSDLLDLSVKFVDGPNQLCSPQGTVMIPFVDNIDSITVKYK